MFVDRRSQDRSKIRIIQATRDSKSTEFEWRRKRRSLYEPNASNVNAQNIDGSGTTAAVPVKEPVT
jgi:hypothetical protein